jgi:general secretion pathway protein J
MMARRARSEAGFTLIEALVALALTGLVLSVLATLTAQWFPNWNRGIDRIQHSELIGLAMQRIAADLAAAEYVPANRETKKPLFEGSALSVTFVRTALGPNAAIGLDMVRIGEATDRGHLVTLRSRASFVPLPPGATVSEQVHLSAPVVLLQPPLRLSFAYAGPDQVFRDSWLNADKLPSAIMLTVRDSSGAVLSASTVTPVHIDAPASGGKSGAGKSDLDSKDDNDGDGDRVAATLPKQGG